MLILSFEELVDLFQFLMLYTKLTLL
jgi:hypothetical protein